LIQQIQQLFVAQSGEIVGRFTLAGFRGRAVAGGLFGASPTLGCGCRFAHYDSVIVLNLILYAKAELYATGRL
jgi:hypothetical protein